MLQGGDFNSIKVQLKQDTFLGVVPNSQLFQFHKGTIKTQVMCAAIPHFGHFNSIKVQLKPLKCVCNSAVGLVISIP